jgi:hypothetical protein
MSVTTQPHDLDPVDVVRDDREFHIEYEPSPLATGWQLRERHHDGWPVLAGPYETRDEAIEAIEEFVVAGPLCCYEDEHGVQSCCI